MSNLYDYPRIKIVIIIVYVCHSIFKKKIQRSNFTDQTVISVRRNRSSDKNTAIKIDNIHKGGTCVLFS